MSQKKWLLPWMFYSAPCRRDHIYTIENVNVMHSGKKKRTLYFLWPSIKEGKMTFCPNMAEMKHIFNGSGEKGVQALSGGRGWYSLNLPGRGGSAALTCTDLCLSVLPAMWINKMGAVWEACPQTGRSWGFSNVNVIQIYGRQIAGCWGYGGPDTVYVTEMRTDKNVCPRASAALWKPAGGLETNRRLNLKI